MDRIKSALKGALTWLNTNPVGQFVRDLIEGGVAGATSAVLLLNLDVTTPHGITYAAGVGAIGGVVAIARRKLVDTVFPDIAPAKPTQ